MDNLQNLDEALEYLNESGNNSKRSKFLNKILNKAKTIVNKYNSQGGFNLADNGNKKNSTNSWFLDDGDEIELIYGDWDELKCFKKYQNYTKHEYADTSEVKKWYDDQEKCIADCEKAFSQYGDINSDGEYDSFFINITLNDKTLDELEG